MGEFAIIVIIQKSSDLDFFSSQKNSITFIAWTAEAVAALEAANYSYSTLEDLGIYYGREVIDEGALYSYSKVVDEIYGNALPNPAGIQLRPMRYRLLSLRRFFYSFHFESHRLDKLALVFKDQKITIVSTPKSWRLGYLARRRIDSNFLVIGDEYIWPEPPEIPHRVVERDILRNIVRWGLGKAPSVSFTDVLRSVTKYGSKSKETKNVFFANLLHDGPKVLREMKSTLRINPVLLDYAPLAKTPRLKLDHEKIVRDILSATKHHPFLEFGGICHSQIYKDLYFEILTKDVLREYAMALTFIELHRRFNFKMVVSFGALGESEIVFHLADQFGIPKSMWLHGGTVGVIKDHLFLPLSFADYKNSAQDTLTVYSPIMKEAVDHQKELFPTFTYNTIPVGSPYLLERLN